MGETGQATDRDGSKAAKRSRSWIGWIALYFVTIYLIWFFIRAAYLAAFASEGALPPTWRDPDVPAGAEVVSVREVCGGNGPCWREIRIRPADGQNASDLAAQMGLSADESRTYGWRPTNPASVEVFVPYGRLGQQRLTIGVQYNSPFPQ